MAVVFGSGDGSFASPVEFPTGEQATAVALADFDGEGGIDIAATVGPTDEVVVMLNDGAGDFAVQPAIVLAGDRPQDIVAADFDLDGIVDLAVVTRDDATLWWLRGVGDGTFEDALTVTAAPPLTLPITLVTADLNGDGVPDFAIGGDHGVATVISSP